MRLRLYERLFDSPGLTFLGQALVDEGIYSVNVCAPQWDKSVLGHAVTLQETAAVTSVDIKGAEAYEVSGIHVDCVSLALSGALFAWSKPVLLISGINKDSRCGSQMMKDESKESDFQDTVSVCLPIIKAALRDIETGIYPKIRSLNIEIPKTPLTNKRLGRPAVALVSTDRIWTTFMKLRLDRVLADSYEASSVEEALSCTPVDIEFKKPTNWVAPYPKYEPGWWKTFLPPISATPNV